MGEPLTPEQRLRRAVFTLSDHYWDDSDQALRMTSAINEISAVADSLDAARAAAPPVEHWEYVWLIERGQQEGLEHTEWWGVVDARTGARGWHHSALAAERFESRADAEGVISRFNLPNHPFNARAVEHGFIRAAAPLDVERLARAFDTDRPGLDVERLHVDVLAVAFQTVTARYDAPVLTRAIWTEVAAEYARLSGDKP